MDMAFKSSLRLVARRIAEAVKISAGDQGGSPGSYALVGSFDNNTDRISLTFGTDAQIDERRLYAETFSEIRRRFPAYPQITMQIGLVIRRVKNLDETYLDLAGAEDEVDLTELL